MSRKTINRIFGLASIDPAFRQQLQKDPLAALATEGFELTSEEREAFGKFCSLPVSQFCQRVLEELSPDEYGKSS